MDVILLSSVVNSLHSTSTSFISFSVIYACMLINDIAAVFPFSDAYRKPDVVSAQEKRVQGSSNGVPFSI